MEVMADLLERRQHLLHGPAAVVPRLGMRGQYAVDSGY